jgi:hypothetical protein
MERRPMNWLEFPPPKTDELFPRTRRFSQINNCLGAGKKTRM